MKPYDAIREKLQKGGVVILDGAIGTEILRRDLTWADHQLRQRPDVIRAIHEDYLRAGAEVISTNSFQLTRRAFTNHFRDLRHLQHIGAPDLPYRADELLADAVLLARQAREAAAVDRAAIAAAVTTLEWCFRPDLSPEPQTAAAEYRQVAGILADAGADLLLLETFNNVAEAAVAAEAGRDAGLPVWVSFVCDSQGHLFSGETPEKAERVLQPLGVEAILLNCAPPADIENGLKKLLAAKREGRPSLGAYPHIGRFDPPEWLFTQEYPPARYADCCRRWAQMGARILGGCCGTTPDHIRALAEVFRIAGESRRGGPELTPQSG